MQSPPPSRDAEAPPLTASQAYSIEPVLPKLVPNGIEISRSFSLNWKAVSAIFVLVALGAVGWVYFNDSHQDAVGEETTTISQINRFEFTSSDLTSVRSRLSSRTDQTLYEFLSLHHNAALLKGPDTNIVTEVLKALEHDSVQTGVPLVMELFTHVFEAWPVVVLPREDRKKIETFYNKITAYLSSASNSTMKEAFEEGVQALLQETRLGLLAIRDSGAQIDNLQLGHFLAESDLARVAAFLKNCLLADITRPYLQRVEQVRSNFLTDLKSVPSDKALAACAEVLKELETFVADKPDVSLLIRSFLMNDLQQRKGGGTG